MGGSIVASRCGDAGLKVLVLEKGGVPRWDGRKKGLLARLRSNGDEDTGERWPTPLLLRSHENATYREAANGLGIGPGGSGRIYGAALGRAARIDFEQDFQPAQWVKNYSGDAPLPNSWPIAYDDFLAAYREAERILSPAGTRDPLDPDDDAALAAPPPISAAHKSVVAQLERNGRHPFRMHVGIAYKPGCTECQGSSCPRGCKAHGFNRALQPAISRQADIALEIEASAHSIDRTPDGGWTVRYESGDGEVREAAATSVVLAAGALNTPRLLERSAHLWNGAAPQLLGRGLMFHAAEIFAVSAPEGTVFSGPRKVIAFRDHYCDGDMPLAECQSLGLVSNPALVRAFLRNAAQRAGLPVGAFGKIVLRPAGEIGFRLYEGSEMFTAAIQDLPYAESRVTSVRDDEGRERIAVTYRAHREFVERIERFRNLMREAFAPLKVRFPTVAGEPNLGHPMGTCRMGSSPDLSVVDPSGQVWQQPGLFVADASVFPSSLGINPALTVAAHSIRVADALLAQFASQGAQASLDAQSG